MKKGGKILLVGIIIFALVIAVIIGAIISNKKKIVPNESYEIDLTDKFVESENIKVSVNNVAYNGKYLILEYLVETEKSEVFEDIETIRNNFNFHLDRQIKINNEILSTSDNYYDQISYKESDNKVMIYDIVDTSNNNIPDKFTVNIEFFENDSINLGAEYEEIPGEEQEIDEADSEEFEEEMNSIDPDEYYNDSENRESLLEEDDEVIDDTLDELADTDMEEDDFIELEEARPEDYEEVQGEYSDIEETDDETKENVYASLNSFGTITFKANIEDLQKGVDTIQLTDQYEYDNCLIDSITLIKTSFKNFIITNTLISNIDYNILVSDDIKDPDNYGIDLKYKDGNTINTGMTKEVIVSDNFGNDRYDIDENSEMIEANINTILVVEEDIDDSSDLVLQPYYMYIDLIEDVSPVVNTIGDGLEIGVI